MIEMLTSFRRAVLDLPITAIIVAITLSPLAAGTARSLDVGQSRGAINTLVDGLEYFFPKDLWQQIQRDVGIPLLSVEFVVNCRYDRAWDPFESRKDHSVDKSVPLQSDDGIEALREAGRREMDAVRQAGPLVAEFRTWLRQKVEPLEKVFRYQIGAVLKMLSGSPDALSDTALKEIAGRIDIVNKHVDDTTVAIAPLVPKIKAFETEVSAAAAGMRKAIVNMKTYALSTLGGLRTEVAQYPCGREVPSNRIDVSTDAVNKSYAKSLARQDEIGRRIAGTAAAANVMLATLGTVSADLKTIRTALLSASGRDAEGRKKATVTLKTILVENELALADDLFDGLVKSMGKFESK